MHLLELAAWFAEWLKWLVPAATVCLAWTVSRRRWPSIATACAIVGAWAIAGGMFMHGNECSRLAGAVIVSSSAATSAGVTQLVPRAREHPIRIGVVCLVLAIPSTLAALFLMFFANQLG